MEAKRTSSKDNDLVMETLVSNKLGMNLLQNCDLPPPLKVFPGSMVRVPGLAGKEEEAVVEDGKFELLKALRLSQTRAREAERKAVQLAAEKDRISDALLRESVQLSAYRHWVRLLEMQVLKLQAQWRNKLKEGELNEGKSGDGISWVVALAICIGIAGVGFLFGSRYLF